MQVCSSIENQACHKKSFLLHPVKYRQEITANMVKGKESCKRRDPSLSIKHFLVISFVTGKRYIEREKKKIGIVKVRKQERKKEIKNNRNISLSNDEKSN